MQEWSKITPFIFEYGFKLDNGDYYESHELPYLLTEAQPGAKLGFILVRNHLSVAVISNLGIEDKYYSIRWIYGEDGLNDVSFPLYGRDGSIGDAEQLKQVFVDAHANGKTTVLSAVSEQYAADAETKFDPVVKKSFASRYGSVRAGRMRASEVSEHLKQARSQFPDVGWMVRVSKSSSIGPPIEFEFTPQLIVHVRHENSRHIKSKDKFLEIKDDIDGLSEEQLSAWYDRQAKPIWRRLSWYQLKKEILNEPTAV